MAMSAEHSSKYAALHRQWWRLHISETFSSGTIDWLTDYIVFYAVLAYFGNITAVEWDYKLKTNKQKTIKLIGHTFAQEPLTRG